MPETKKYYHNLDVDNNKIVNLLLNPLTTAQRTAVGTLLGPLDEGYVCFDTTLNQQFFWDGTTWIAVTGGGGTWGSITGVITAQTDLITYLSSNYVPFNRNITINGVTQDLSVDRTWTIAAGVSSVTASTPLASSGGATPNITIQQASGSQNGFLSSTDWTTFNGKQNAITLTTTGTSGAATFIANTLNIPQYQAAGTYVTSVGATGPITSSGGTTPTISTSMATNRLIGRTTAGTGVMEEISVGTGLTLSSGTLSATAQVPGFEQHFLLMGA